MNKKILQKVLYGINNHTNEDKEHKKIYKIHKYWARKPWPAIADQILRYSKKGDLVYDPFMGSGVMGVESILNGRDFLGGDLNPVAVLVSKETMNTFYSDKIFESEIEDFYSKISSYEKELFSTDKPCDCCGTALCYKHIYAGPKFKEPYGKVYCPHCRSKKVEKDVDMSIYDKDKANLILSRQIEYWIPETAFPEKFYKDRFSYKGIKKVTDFFSRRNLLALSYMYNIIRKSSYINKELFLLALNNSLLHATKLKGVNVRPLGVNNYWIPDDYIDENPFFRVRDRIKSIREAKKVLIKTAKNSKSIGAYQVMKRSALTPLPKESVDYCISDPPYGDAIQYSELSFIWNAWLSTKYENKDEIIINPVQDKREKEFEVLLLSAIENIYEALKEDGYFTLCFQNKNYSVWRAIIEKCKEIGLALISVDIYDTLGSSFTQNWAKFSPKADIYVTFQKKQGMHHYSYEDTNNISSIIKDILVYARNKSIEIDDNKIYDIVISYLIWDLYYNKKSSEANFDLKEVVSTFGEIIGG